MGDMLSQEEINALLGEANTGGDTPPEEEQGGQVSKGNSDNNNNILTSEEKDILGEIGNISMGTATTTLFALLNQKVNITTPKVSVISWSEISDKYDRPCVGIKVAYKEGLIGANMLILKQSDVKIIADLMMGGTGEIDTSADLTEIDLSAIAEAMNQMVGSSSTSLSSMLDMKIDIDTPNAFIIDFNYESFYEQVGFMEEPVVCTSFRMEIGDLIDSEIMQILPVEFAMNMVATIKGGIGGGYSPEPEEVQPEPAPAPAPTPAPQEVSQPQPIPQQQPMPQQQYQMPPQYDYSQYQMPPQPMYQQPNVNVQPAQFQNFDVASVMQQKENIGIIMDVPLEITVELGRTSKTIKEILEFSPGTVVELDKLAGEPIDILVNGKNIAKGEVVVIDENFGIRLTDIVSVENRI